MNMLPGTDSEEFKNEARKARKDGVKCRHNKPSKKKRTPSLTAYCINGTTEQLRREMREAVFIMESVAIRGQYTAICAPPNGGKTLLTLSLIMQAVKAKVLEGDKIFYINVDDNQEGAIIKTELVQPLGINMVVPVLADPQKTGNTPFNFLEIIQSKIDGKTVDGEVIVIDTYKKFVNTMDKEIQSGFNDVLRQFVTLGGSVIVLTHVNKNRDQEGKLVWGGTSDLKDDCDAGWIIDNSKSTAGITYEFFFQKGRGHSGNDSAYFSPSGTHGNTDEDQLSRYRRLLEGIVPQSMTEAEAMRQESVKADRENEMLSRFHPAVTFIKELLAEGMKSRTEIQNEYKSADVQHEVSKRNFDKVVSAFSGKMWDVTKVGKQKMYSLNENYLPPTNTGGQTKKVGNEGFL